MAEEIEVGDRVVVINPHGLKIDCVVEAITDDHGSKLYHIASKDFAMVVERTQIAEVHKA